MAKFLFCLPRYHTNAVPWTRILESAGHRVAVDVVDVGPTENWTYVTPVRHEPGTWCKRFFGKRLAKPDGSFYSFPGWWTYWRHLQRENPDVVIVRGLTRWFSRIAALCVLLQGRRLVVYDQESPAPPLSSTWVRRALCRIAGVRHFTPKLDETAGDGLGTALQIPFGCPFPSPPAPRKGRGRKAAGVAHILMVAKYRDRKRHVDLIRALGLIAGQHRFAVTFCGEQASEADLRYCAMLTNLAAECGIADRLSFRNNMPHDAMMDVYLSHDLFVLPSTREPAAVSPLEAAWAGCAVVVAKGSGTRSYLPPDNRFEAEDCNAADLSRAIAGLIGNADCLERAKIACRDRIQKISCDELIAEKFLLFI